MTELLTLLQAHATVFAVRFFGRAGFMTFIAVVSELEGPGFPSIGSTVFIRLDNGKLVFNYERSPEKRG